MTFSGFYSSRSFVLEIIRACPYCRFPTREKVSEPGNGASLSGVYWSDGKEHLPFFPTSSRIVRCENCSKYYWKRNAPVIGTCDPASNDPEMQPDAWEHVWLKDTFPSLEDSVAALDQHFFENDAQELYVRTLVWWGINDPVRFGKQKHISREHKTLFSENLLRMRDLYELVGSTVGKTTDAGKAVSMHGVRNGKLIVVDNPDHLVETCRLHCAEISRELGDFDLAGQYLAGEFEVGLKEAAELKNVIEKKKVEVHKFSWSQTGQAGPPSEFATGNVRVKNREKIEKQKRKAWDEFVDMFK